MEEEGRAVGVNEFTFVIHTHFVAAEKVDLTELHRASGIGKSQVAV